MKKGSAVPPVSEKSRSATGRKPLPFPIGNPLAQRLFRERRRQRARDRRPIEVARTDLDEMSQLIKELSGLRYKPLTFPGSLERQFETDTAVRRAKRFWLEGLLVIVLYNLLLIGDYFGSHGIFWRGLMVRTCVITPLALAVNLCMLFRPKKYFREASVAVVACLAGLSNLYLARGLDPTTSAYAQFGTLAVILFLNTLMRLRLPYALGATLTMLAGDAIFLHADRMLALPDKILGLLLTFASAAATLIANYSFSREERLNYLLCLQGGLMVEELSKANESLKHMAERDTLTGLANRRLFAERITEEWERARRQGLPLSVIIIDIDHFKRINDTYGHPYGDRVITRIGRLLLESLRRKDDLAVRYGGEEFILLLPDTSQDLALMVADRIRRVVQTAGLPALDPGHPPLAGLNATISCGVAGTCPEHGNDVQTLIDAADQALFRAKKGGRNRTCAAA